MIGHRLMGTSLLCTGDIAEGRAASTIGRSRFTILPSIVRWRRDLARTLGWQSCATGRWALWLLGYPEAALADVGARAQGCPRDRQAATLMFALHHASLTHIHCGNYAAANALLDELVALANEKGASFWKAFGMLMQGCLLVLDRQSLGRCSPDHLRAARMAVNRSNNVDARILIIFGESLCGRRQIR